MGYSFLEITLGLVAGMCHELKLVATLDHLLPPTEKQIGHGTAVCAMILNGLGFVNQRLYLIPDFFRNNPVEQLLVPGITADQLNDATVGRTLDAIYAANPTEVSASIAANRCLLLGLEPRSGHLDSTSFHADGQYNSAHPPQEGVVWITRGSSRDHRPELNQGILNLMVESQTSIPIHMSMANGNSEDNTGARALIQTYIASLQNVHRFTYLVDDSALYVEDTLKVLADRVLIISRMPATLSIANALLTQVDVPHMHVIDETSRSQEVCGVYADVKQRWLIVYSQQAYDRDLRTVTRQMVKQGTREQKAFCRRPFACRADAQRVWEKFEKTLTCLSVVDLQIQEKPHDARRGKPRQGERPTRVEYCLRGLSRRVFRPGESGCVYRGCLCSQPMNLMRSDYQHQRC